MSLRPGLDIGPTEFIGDVARRLLIRLDADLDERYAADDADLQGVPDHTMLAVPPSDVVAPLGAFLVAWLDGEPVGCGAVRPAPTREPATAELKRMYVVPEARGRGISRELLDRLEGAARDLGYRRMILETGLRQPEAMALYESAGYTPIASYGGYRDSPLSRCYEKAL
jgi:GNAT superfamily N-acetyltransferase